MQKDRRAMMLGGVGMAAAGLAAAALVGCEKKTDSAVTVDADLELKIRKDLAERQIEKTINRYEGLLSAGLVEAAFELFAVSQPDVQADVGFGFYYGPESVKRLFVGLHGWLELNDQGKLRNGALYIVPNTTGIVEVADDLKTAKGHWLCPTISTPGSPEKGFSAMPGYAHRVADFIYENGQWKIWHYFVYGILYYPEGKAWTDPAVYEAETGKPQDLSWIPEQFQPDAPSDTAAGIGKEAVWRPDRPPTTVRLPEPYRTFSETFSYARK